MVNNYFNSRREQLVKYAITKETYPPDTQRGIEFILRDSNDSRHKVEQRLSYILNILPINYERIPVTAEEVFNRLDTKFFKMERQKKLIKDVYASRERAGRKGCCFLFVGPPGVGKTALMTAISEAMQLPFECIPLNGCSTPFELEGLDPGYDTADAGAIVRAFELHGTSEMILGLDEFDKVNRCSKEGDPMNVFLRLFQGLHYDKYLQCHISTENTIFIATANSIEDIPETILNRFNAIIYFDEYTHEDKFVIAKQYVIPEVLKIYNLSSANVTFEDCTIEYIIRNYCEDAGVRDLKNNIEKIICRIIGSGGADLSTVVTPDYAESVLNELVEETQGLRFIRNKEHYTDSVAKEIKKCLEESKKNTSFDPDRFKTEKMRQKLDYLLACRKEDNTFRDEFNPLKLSDLLHKSLFGMDNVIREVTGFFYTEYLKGKRLNSNLVLVGDPGIGKTTIVNNIAIALSYKYIKISLNGISNIKELRGTPSTYTGSEPGRIMKGIKTVGTTRAIMHLDEIDKLKAEYASALLDLLDHSFTDNYLDVSVDLTQTIFIATANDWANVPAVIRDRFVEIKVDGYTRYEKEKIISDYIIPKVEESYAASGVSISIDDKTMEYLLKTYASTFGVRDAEMAIQRICSGKLVNQTGEENWMKIAITIDDVRKYLGEEPIPRGNFPSEAVSGVSKALAVSDNKGSTFAIETRLLEGEETLEITGLPKEMAVDSVRVAVTCIKEMYPNILDRKHIHVHFGEGSVQKDGPSAGVALFMSILSAALNKPIINEKPYDISYTGELSLSGGIFAVGSIFQKIQAACDSGCSKVYIPEQNYERLDKDKISKYNCEVVPVANISEIVEDIYPELKEE